MSFKVLKRTLLSFAPEFGDVSIFEELSRFLNAMDRHCRPDVVKSVVACWQRAPKTLISGAWTR